MNIRSKGVKICSLKAVHKAIKINQGGPSFE